MWYVRAKTKASLGSELKINVVWNTSETDIGGKENLVEGSLSIKTTTKSSLENFKSNYLLEKLNYFRQFFVKSIKLVTIFDSVAQIQLTIKKPANIRAWGKELLRFIRFLVHLLNQIKIKNFLEVSANF